MKLIPLLFLALVSFSQVAAQKPIRVSERVLDSLARVVRNPESPLEFTDVKIDAGEVKAEDGVRELVFNYSNVSEKAVRISRVVPSCGCVSARFDMNEIPSGSAGSIVARFNPGRHIGPFSYNVRVYVEGLESPSNTLVLKGKVTPPGGYPDYPVPVGELRLTRRAVSFGEVSYGSLREERVACVNTGDKPLRVRAFGPMLPEGLSLRTEPEVIPPKGEADIVITLRPSEFPDSLLESGKALLILDGVDAKPSEKSIEIEFTLKTND